jgi:hypothetical protein
MKSLSVLLALFHETERNVLLSKRSFYCIKKNPIGIQVDYQFWPKVLSHIKKKNDGGIIF